MADTERRGFLCLLTGLFERWVDLSLTDSAIVGILGAVVTGFVAWQAQRETFFNLQFEQGRFQQKPGRRLPHPIWWRAGPSPLTNWSTTSVLNNKSRYASACNARPEEPLRESDVLHLREFIRTSPRIVVVVAPTPRAALALASAAIDGADDKKQYHWVRDHCPNVFSVDLRRSPSWIDVHTWIAQIERHRLSLGFRWLGVALVRMLNAFFGGLSAWLTMTENVSSLKQKSEVSDTQDEANILASFFEMLQFTNQLVPEGAVLIMNNLETLTRLNSTPIGAKALAMFFEHLIDMSQSIHVVLVCGSGLVHNLLFDLVVSEQISVVSIGEMNEAEAREYFGARLRSRLHLYRRPCPSLSTKKLDATGSESTTSDSLILPESAVTTHSNEAAILQSEALMTKALDAFPSLFAAVGGRACDLVAFADLIVSQPDALAQVSQSTSSLSHNAAEIFPDLSFCIRWLAFKLDHRTAERTQGVLSKIENLGSPKWTLAQAMVLFDAMLASSSGWLIYDDAIKSCDGDCKVLSSMIEHGIIGYRPQSTLYRDVPDLLVQYELIGPVRQLHLFAYKRLKERGWPEVQ